MIFHSKKWWRISDFKISCKKEFIWQSELFYEKKWFIQQSRLSIWDRNFSYSNCIFCVLPSGSFWSQFLYKKPVVHLAIGILLPNNHCHAPTYQTACSAQDTAHKQYRTRDPVVQSEHHVVYHCLVYEEPYFDESGKWRQQVKYCHLVIGEFSL